MVTGSSKEIIDFYHSPTVLVEEMSTYGLGCRVAVKELKEGNHNGYM